MPFDHPVASGIFEECTTTACAYFEIRTIAVHPEDPKKAKKSSSLLWRFFYSLFKGMKVLVFGL